MEICKTFNILKIQPPATKQLLRMCFAEAKVVRYTDFFESVKQLLFGTVSHGCFSIPHKRQTASQQIIAVQGQQYKVQRNFEMFIKFTINTPERGQLISSWCLIVNFEHILSRFIANSNITFQNNKVKQKFSKHKFLLAMISSTIFIKEVRNL